MIKVLVVEDSAVVREFLVYILTSDLDIEVVATVADGKEAVEAAGRYKPDVITMAVRSGETWGGELHLAAE